MEDKILCNISDLSPIADAIREKENTNKLYSVEELKVKVPELISSGSEIELPILPKLNAVNGGTVASTMADAVDNTETLVGSQTNLIAQIATALEDKAAGGGSTTLETGTLPSTTSYIVSPYSDYYFDLEAIPNIASKMLIALRFAYPSNHNPLWILSRNSTSDDFSLSTTSGTATFATAMIDGYVFELKDSLIIVGELAYYAA